MVKCVLRPERHTCQSIIKSLVYFTVSRQNKAFTLDLSTYSFICVLLKSHCDKSSSTSPRKLFRPKVSLCHTEMFKFRDFNTSIVILNCERRRRPKRYCIWYIWNGVMRCLWKNSYPEDFIKGRVWSLLFYWGFSLSQHWFVRQQITFHIPKKIWRRFILFCNTQWNITKKEIT